MTFRGHEPHEMAFDEATLREFVGGDRFARSLGIELVEVRPGFARTLMVVRGRHMNGLGTVHGGAMFGLADFTFAVAANAHGGVAVAVNTDMAFVKPVAGGVLHGEASQVSSTPRLAVYDVAIRDDAGETVALFRGTAYRKRETVAEALARREGMRPGAPVE